MAKEPRIMSDCPSEAEDNPYSAPAEISEAPQFKTVESDVRERSLIKTIVIWSIVCVISAIPSFVVGIAITDGRAAGMLIGITTFIAAYTFLDLRTRGLTFRRSRAVRRTLRIVYGTRIAISVIFPIGFWIDLMIGSLSVGVVGGLMGQESPEGFEMEFFATYLTTILQGILLNGVLVPYGLIVLVIVKFTIRATSPQAIELSGESKDTVSAE